MSGVGGGIWCEADNQPFLRGLTSFGKSCDADGYPGVGVNIAEFYGWLKATITRAPVCQPGACYPGVCIETIDNPAGFICKGTDPCTDEIDDCPLDLNQCKTCDECKSNFRWYHNGGECMNNPMLYYV